MPQPFLGDAEFVDARSQTIAAKHAADIEKSKLQQRAATSPVSNYAAVPQRNSAVRQTYATGLYTMKQIAQPFSFQYASISLVACKGDEANEIGMNMQMQDLTLFHLLFHLNRSVSEGLTATQNAVDKGIATILIEKARGGVAGVLMAGTLAMGIGGGSSYVQAQTSAETTAECQARIIATYDTKIAEQASK